MTVVCRCPRNWGGRGLRIGLVQVNVHAACGDGSPQSTSHAFSLDDGCQWPAPGDGGKFWLEVIDGELDGTENSQDVPNAVVDARELRATLCRVVPDKSQSGGSLATVTSDNSTKLMQDEENGHTRCT